MVKQQLWMLNSSLLGIFVLALLLSISLQKPIPLFKIKKPIIEIAQAPKQLSKASIESIFKNDLFGTFFSQPSQPIAKPLVTPIPQLKTVSVPPPPPAAKPEFIPALPLTLKGIAFSLDEDKSIGMLADETQKEQIYHLGEPIKDAILLKVACDHLTLLRANGQHETIFLRHDDLEAQPPAEKKWDGLVKKAEENSFELDIRQFPEHFTTLGDLIRAFSMLTIYRDGKPIGIKIGNLAPQSIGNALGLASGDVITTINNMTTADKKNRIAIYDKLIQAKKGDTIKIEVERANQPLALSYKLTHIEKEISRVFAPTPATTPPAKPPLKMSQLQAREERTRKFAEKHPPQQQKTIEEIRQRLLENMKARARNARVR